MSIDVALSGLALADGDLRMVKDGSLPMLAFLVKSDDLIVRVVTFGDLATDTAPSIVKGVPVAVTGKVKLDRWTGRDGVEKTGLGVTAVTVAIAGAKKVKRAKTRGAKREWSEANDSRPFDDEIPDLT